MKRNSFQSRYIRRRLSVALSMLICAAPLAAAPGPGAVPRGGGLLEEPVLSLAQTPGLIETQVWKYSPLPASMGDHPAACDWISYVRYRDKNGPADSSAADAVFAMQPGFGAGPTETDILARNTVLRSAALGRHVEFWTDNHRWSCLIDRRGLDAAIAAKDYHVAVDYYFNQKPVGGQVFGGYPDQRKQAFLAHVDQGVAVRDWYDLLTASITDPAIRARKILCGGHSYGGVFTSIFAAWGFGADPHDPSAAGYAQCAGFFAVDSLAGSDPGGLSGKPVLGGLVGSLGGVVDDVVHGIAAAGIPTIDVGEAKLMTMVSIMGVAAYFQPNDETDLLRILPHDPLTDIFLHAVLARTYTQFLTNIPDMRSFRYTNAALLASLTDDNVGVLPLGQLGLGSFGGGPVDVKTFPLPNIFADIPLIGPYITAVLTPGPNTKVGPVDPNALYTWNDYRAIPGKDRNGKDYTSRDNENVDIHDYARTVAEGPGQWVEPYVPISYTVGAGASLVEGGRQGGYDKDLLFPEAMLDKPRGFIFGVHSGVTVALNTIDPFLALINPGAPLVPVDSAMVPNYLHYAMASGAQVQNDGKPEQVSDYLSRFAIKTIH